MSATHRRAAWLGAFLFAGRLLLRLHPVEYLEAVGVELVEAMEARLVERRARRGFFAACLLGITELIDLAVAGLEARRELARAARLGSPGHSGLDPAGGVRVLAADTRDALRGVVRTPGPTAMIVLLIGVGVGASAALFAVVDDVLLEPLPFDEPDGLVHVWSARAWQGDSRALLADLQIMDLQERARTLEYVSAFWMVSGRVLGGDRPIHTDVARVSAGFFDMIGVEPLLGRTFEEGEDQPGAAWAALLTYASWQRDFGGSVDVLGRPIRVCWQDMTVVGVLPPDFRFDVPAELGAHGVPDLWIPWWHAGSPTGRVGGGTLAAVARVAEGTSLDDARAELAALAADEDAEHYGGRGFTYVLEPLHDVWVAEARPGLVALSGAVLVLFLIAVLNASTLLLTRSQLRAGELEMRRVLGASAARLARLVGLETLLLAVAGGFIGLAVASLGTLGLAALAPPGLPLGVDAAPDPRVFLFALSGSLAAAVVAALAPVARTARARPACVLSTRGARRARARGSGRLRSAFVTSQVAFSVVLLVAAGLLVRTFVGIRGLDLGFAEQGRVTFSVYLMDEYDSHAGRMAFYDGLRARIARLDGVTAVSGTSALPLSDGVPRLPVSTFRRENDVDPETFFLTEGVSVLGAGALAGTRGDGWTLADATATHPDYFDAMGVRVVEGRSLDERDLTASEWVVAVDRSLARGLWPGTGAVGQKVWVAGAWREVVGVVEPVRFGELRGEVRPQVFLPSRQIASGRVSMVVRADRPVGPLVDEIRSAVTEIDPLVPIADARTVESLVDDRRARDRFGMSVMAAFAATAVVLVALGLYGALDYVVGERLREIAVRRVVGSGGVRVAALVWLAALRVALPGVAAGLVIAWVAGRAVGPLLYGVTPTDPMTYAAASALLVAVTVAACWRPARRAASADPMSALRVG